MPVGVRLLIQDSSFDAAAEDPFATLRMGTNQMRDIQMSYVPLTDLHRDVRNEDLRSFPSEGTDVQ